INIFKVTYLKKIKESFGRYIIRKKTKSIKRKVIVHNFNTAKTAGVLFNIYNDNSYDYIKDFLNFLNSNNIQVIALGYTNLKTTPEELLIRKNINIINKKDLNWYGDPKNELVTKFIEKDIDILFDLSLKDTFPLKYIGSLSKASFKVSKESDYNNSSDIMLNIKKDESLKYFIEQIKHYLSIINHSN
ncbi:MAG: hypothetical protein PF487_15095, partial [Bacteroidales bacterium]|nr:hypothetical protein [Bacteroidales bacterium]